MITPPTPLIVITLVIIFLLIIEKIHGLKHAEELEETDLEDPNDSDIEDIISLYKGPPSIYDEE